MKSAVLIKPTWLFTILYMALSLAGCDETISTENISNYNSMYLPNKMKIFPTTSRYDSIFLATMDEIGLPNLNISINETDQAGVFSQMNKLNNTRSFIYNVKFLDSVRDATGSDLAIKSICLHELAHQFYGHPLLSILTQAYELQADRYSGYQMCIAGATLDQSLAAMNAFGNIHSTPTHPDKESRLEAIREGYIEAKIKIMKDTSYIKLQSKGELVNKASIKASRDVAVAKKESHWPKTSDLRVKVVYNLLGQLMLFDNHNVVLYPSNKVVGQLIRSKNKEIDDIILIEGVRYFLNSHGQITCINPDGTKMKVGKKELIVPALRAW